MADNKKVFEDLYKGNRSFSVLSKVMAYFSQKKMDADVEAVHRDEWNSIVSNDQIPNLKSNHLFYRLKYQILLEKNQRQKRLMARVLQVAAVLVLPLALFFLITTTNDRTPVDSKASLIEMHCPEGVRTKFTLPDGSSGWLAGGTVMSYEANFEKGRKVSVEGEAFFKVMRDEKRPFTVRLGALDVEVLGTQFNVLNYRNDPVSEVVVLSGLVEVSGNTKNFTTQLAANKKLQFEKEGSKAYLSDVDAQSYTSWIDGRLEFNSESLAAVGRKIERFYDVDVELNMNGLENNAFRANVKIGSLEELLNYMTLALPIKYELVDATQLDSGKIERRKLIISRE
ncbi:MAG: FecR domain-containing protein [Bacteroidales bacterium]|nr:FecR domain-containing protein [Bacteroidales bacterium]